MEVSKEAWRESKCDLSLAECQSHHSEANVHFGFWWRSLSSRSGRTHAPGHLRTAGSVGFAVHGALWPTSLALSLNLSRFLAAFCKRHSPLSVDIAHRILSSGRATSGNSVTFPSSEQAISSCPRASKAAHHHAKRGRAAQCWDLQWFVL
jgi:hypothetical protein